MMLDALQHGSWPKGSKGKNRVSNPVVTPQGVPLRVELGVKDLEKGSVLVARRDTGAKEVVPWADLPARAPALLEQIQARRLSPCAVCARQRSV